MLSAPVVWRASREQGIHVNEGKFCGSLSTVCLEASGLSLQLQCLHSFHVLI